MINCLNLNWWFLISMDWIALWHKSNLWNCWERNIFIEIQWQLLMKYGNKCVTNKAHLFFSNFSNYLKNQHNNWHHHHSISWNQNQKAVITIKLHKEEIKVSKLSQSQVQEHLDNKVLHNFPNSLLVDCIVSKMLKWFIFLFIIILLSFNNNNLYELILRRELSK